MKFLWFVCILLINLNTFPLDYAKKQGDFANSYTTEDSEILNWLSNFKVVEFGGVGDPCSKDSIIYLKSNGTKVLLYDWMPATYYYLDGENNSLAQWTYENRYFATLNPDGPFPHTEEMGYTWARDYYFDYGEEEVINRRVEFEFSFLKNHLYDGFFYDWGSGNFINDEVYYQIKQNFENKHQGLHYLDSVSNFYRKVREIADSNNLIIFTNQGYRTENHVLPYVDYDMAESYIVGYDYFGKYLDVEGYGNIEVPQTQYFPVSNEGEESFSDTLYFLNIIKNLIEQYAGENFKKFVFMDYAAPEFKFNEETGKYIPVKPEKAIYLSFATAKLINQTSYLEVTFDKKLEFDDIYFVDLGKPLDSQYSLNNEKNYAIRFFENGIVIVYFGDETETTIEITNDNIPININFFDMFRKEWEKAEGKTITISISTEIDPLTGKTIPAGRILMYEKIHRIKPVESITGKKFQLF